MEPINRCGDLTMWCIASALADGSIGYGDANDIADTLANGDPWCEYDAIHVAAHYGVLGSGPLHTFTCATAKGC